MSKEYLEAFKIVYNNFDYLISDVCIENDDVNICLKTIKEQLPTIKQALHRLESIDNANPSEALNVLKATEKYTGIDLTVVKNALLKAQEPKKYLKWEDLEFDNNASVKKHLKVKLGDNIYKAYYHYCFILNSELFCIENDNENLNIYITNRQFFNDLHLERVEE